MVDRRTVTLLAGASLLLAVNVLYGVVEIAATPDLVVDQAFVIAAISWVVGYVYCEGQAWDEASDVTRGLFGASWILLFGMEFTEYVPDLIAGYEPWAGVAAVLIHMVSYYLTALAN